MYYRVLSFIHSCVNKLTTTTTYYRSLNVGTFVAMRFFRYLLMAAVT